MVYPNILGLQCQMLILLVTFKVPVLHQIQSPGAEAAIRKGLSIMKIWENNPSIHILVERLETFMTRLGIPHAQEMESFPALAPNDHQVDRFSSQVFGEGWSHYGQATAAM